MNLNPRPDSPSKNPAAPLPMPARALAILVCGLLATWLAAGSLGWISPPLQKTLVWLAFGAILTIAFRGRGAATSTNSLADFWQRHRHWLLAAVAVAAVLMTASALAVVNILAVAVLLAAVALVRPGWIADAAAPAALAATALALVRLVCEGTATGWALAETIGRAEGRWAALLTGRPLLIGPSFGGVDFLVVMLALAVAWHQTAPGRNIKRAVAAALAIAAAQTVYLVALAFTHDLASMLPPPSHAMATDVSRLGVWTWSNAVHAMLPWHLPVLAALLHGVVAVFMFRLVEWPAPHYATAEEMPFEVADSRRRDRRQRRIVGNPVDTVETVRPQAALRLFAPAGLVIIAAAAVGLAPLKPDLAGRRIVVYDDGSIDWTTNDPGNVAPGLLPSYGLLPALVASLGGEFIVSRDLNTGDLRDASVLLVLPPGAVNKPATATGEMPSAVRERIWSFVKAGGGLVVAGEPETRLGVGDNVHSALLESTAMSLRDDTANSLTDRWEYNLLAAPMRRLRPAVRGSAVSASIVPRACAFPGRRDRL